MKTDEKEFEGKKITVLNCSKLEFNIRWWGMAISIAVFGVTMGILAPF